MSTFIFSGLVKMSLLPKALAAVLAPMELPMTHVVQPPQPLREVVVHKELSWNPFVGLCGRRPPKAEAAGADDAKKNRNDEDPIEIISKQGSAAVKVRTVLRPADLV